MRSISENFATHTGAKGWEPMNPRPSPEGSEFQAIPHRLIILELRGRHALWRARPLKTVARNQVYRHPFRSFFPASRNAPQVFPKKVVLGPLRLLLLRSALGRSRPRPGGVRSSKYTCSSLESKSKWLCDSASLKFIV